ncbi:hypothetical protein [Desulfoluna spongiiphila]|uniref:hypothetical protein n=1 Tax=Desulfoluna spongiiphila TaxID=419481 RepID=UPI00125B867F|nr:hypothetical protein [Desulfoluna spongiiphila]VVS90985.1 hypothetical protein DBB_5530 [Desulfoluna spongiiphila]
MYSSAPPEITIDDIEHNFLKRTYSFDYYKKQLSIKNPRLLNWIGSIDYSGYQREKSLIYLVNNYKPGDENRILLRLEDWVQTISDSAKSWVFENFNNLSLKQIDDQHRLILYLSRKERLTGTEVLTFINNTLLEKAFNTDDSSFYRLNSMLRRHIYNLNGNLDPVFRKRILRDKDPFNRIILLQKFNLDELTGNEIECLKNDKSVFIKRKFLYLQVSYSQKPPKNDLIVFSYDKNIGIREFARFYLMKFYAFDPYSLYKQQTDYIYYFIADYAKKEDFDIFLEGFKSDNQMVKHLCLKAVCKIDYFQLRSANLIDLFNSNKRVRKLTCHYLPKILSLKELAEIKTDIVSKASNGNAVYLYMVFQISIWDFINESLIYFINEPDNDHKKYILGLYYQKSYIYEKLNPALRKKITMNMEILESNSNHRIKSFIEHLKFTLKTA